MPWIQEPTGLWVRVDYTSVPIRSRLVSRFNLQEYAQDPNAMLVMANRIQPVTQVDDLLRTIEIDNYGPTDPTSTGFKTGWTVPNGERWGLIAYQFLGSTAGTTLGGIRLNNGTNTITIDSPSAAQYIDTLLVQRVPVQEGWTIEFQVVAYNATDTVTGYLLYEKEDSYE